MADKVEISKTELLYDPLFDKKAGFENEGQKKYAF